MELVTVTTVSDAGLANVVVGVLQQAGVEAVVGGSGAPRRVSDAVRPPVPPSSSTRTTSPRRVTCSTSSRRCRTTPTTKSDPGRAPRRLLSCAFLQRIFGPAGRLQTRE